jgi:UDP-N-acetylmuramoyl-tripeptide--D-alanyl-D-alanine ligase
VHLGFFRSIEEIAGAKRELIDELGANDTAVLNADDEFVSKFGRNFRGRVVGYALERPADVRGEDLELRGLMGSAFMLVTPSGACEVSLPLLGRHNVYNALAAIAAALSFGIGPSTAAEVLAHLQPMDKRGKVFTLAGALVINDCYNSNPRALNAMVDVLAGIAPGPGGRRSVVAGEMLELGSASEDLHRDCGRHMARCGIDAVVGVRGLAKFVAEGARHQPPARGRLPRMTAARFLETVELAGEWLAKETRPGDVIMLKASRGVRLERALEIWQERLGSGAIQPPGGKARK